MKRKKIKRRSPKKNTSPESTQDSADSKPEKQKKDIKNMNTWKTWVYVLMIVITMAVIPVLLFCLICKTSNMQPSTEKTITEMKSHDAEDIHISRVNMKLSKETSNDNPYFFLFLIAVLGFEGAGIFFICMCCREKAKHALLTDAYDKAMEKLGNRCDKQIFIIPGKGFEQPKTKEIKYEARTIAKIFETYCQNITAK